MTCPCGAAVSPLGVGVKCRTNIRTCDGNVRAVRDVSYFIIASVVYMQVYYLCYIIYYN